MRHHTKDLLVLLILPGRVGNTTFNLLYFEWKANKKFLFHYTCSKGSIFVRYIGKSRSIVDDSSEIHYSILKNMKDFFSAQAGRIIHLFFFNSLANEKDRWDEMEYVEKVAHNLENSHFFCHSYFTWNQSWLI